MNNAKQKQKELSDLAAKYNQHNRNCDGLYLFVVGEYSNITDELLNILPFSIKAESESKALVDLVARVTEYNRVSKDTIRQIA